MVHKTLRIALCAVLGFVSGAASARLYVCTTASGRTISADRPPPECADRPIRELRSDGSVKRVIEPPLTPEQRAALEAERKRQMQEAERQRAQMRRDLSLLETYANEAEIENARHRALADRQALIERAQRRLQELLRERKRLEEESEFYVRRELPEKLKREIAANEEMIRVQEKVIADAKADMARVNERYDAEAKRFRELVNAGAKPVQRGPLQ
ncbi:MAG: hypothetical protein RMK97_06550 [Sutterellaceae bacterium]|nr:hypothetical protein [Burkholderiaceae bacterium]MCX7901547.1 hypothetical protein [Burkholderiaceae bacterium]MDW8430147.1 hypothetical protein [Sutterellaceae bacterium]